MLFFNIVASPGVVVISKRVRYDALGRSSDDTKIKDRSYSLMDTFNDTGVKYRGGGDNGFQDLVKQSANGVNGPVNDQSFSSSNESKSPLSDILDEVILIQLIQVHYWQKPDTSYLSNREILIRKPTWT